ncbi:MAG: hypothetical protein ACTSSP_05370 [Candidatus Asgardarchaeia archaeon]|nr:hypothetical protein [Candidatus Odinarchaeota archaeon]
MGTISVSNETRKELLRLKIEENVKSIDELLKKMITQYKKIKFLEASQFFRKRVKEKQIDLDELLPEEILVIEIAKEREKGGD